MKYYPKRPVKSFQDLEVYQKTLGLAVEIVKKTSASFTSEVKSADTSEVSPAEIANKLAKMTLAIPRLIASAHSWRFGDPGKAVQALEKTMLNCNLAVYYLELYRDLANPVSTDISRSSDKNKKNKSRVPTAEIVIDHDFFEEQIKEYLKVRGRIMRLQRSWIKFMSLKEKND